MKLWQTKKKLVYLLILFIIIFSVAIITSIILIQNKDNETKKTTSSKQIKPIVNTSFSLVKTIRSKIRNNYLVLNKDVDTSNPKKLLQVVKKQLKKQNPQLTVADLAKITLPANFTPILGFKNKVNLRITVFSPDKSSEIILKEIFLKKQRELLANSNIKNGENGFIFQDDQGNLWAMGHGTKLQVLKKGVTSWTDDQTKEPLLKGFNIENWRDGFIFQDRQGNLWAMANGTKLQVLKKVGAGYASSWTDDLTKGLTKGSKIEDGGFGFIFQDRQGNLWAMANGTKLQVLKWLGDKYADSWIDDENQEPLLKGSKIRNGLFGFIFQDDQGNLWALGYETKLQVLKKEGAGYASSWTDDLTKGFKSGIGNGFIFQDWQGNLWAMAVNTKLQVLKKVGAGYAKSWTDDQTQELLLKGSQIRNGYGGFIFQDRQGNLWAMADNTKLQVLREGSDSWES